MTILDATVVFWRTGRARTVAELAQQRKKASEYLEGALEIAECARVIGQGVGRNRRQFRRGQRRGRGMARPAVVLLRSLASRARRLGPQRLLSWIGAPAHATALTVPTIGTSRQNDVEIPSGTLRHFLAR